MTQRLRIVAAVFRCLAGLRPVGRRSTHSILRQAFLSLTVALVAVAVFAGSPALAASSTGDQVGESAVKLAERFSPIIMLKKQTGPCDREGEAFIPMPVEMVLDNPQIALRQLGSQNLDVSRGPDASDLNDLGEGFFLDFPGNSLTASCVFEQDFKRFSVGYRPTVYAHVIQQADEPDAVFLQYWFWWYYNDWNNTHESDWEGITLKFEAPSIEKALTSEPVAVGYSQHEGAERADWDDSKLSKEGDHPVVYSSAGSHASYFGSAVYLGRSGSEGFGCDDTSGPSRRIAPDVVVLPGTVDDPSDPLAWLSFEGRWGEQQSGPFNGPTGPAMKDRWLEPATWFDDLRSNSVVIPGGDYGSVEQVFDVFCGAVATGSNLLITFTTSPQWFLLAVLVLGLVVQFVVGRTKWNWVDPSPVPRRRRAGQIMRGAFWTYRKSPSVYMTFGLVYLPAAIATGLLVALIQLIPFVSTLLSLAGKTSGTSLVLTGLAGSIANVAAYVFVNAVVAEYLDNDERGFTAAIGAVKATWYRRRELGRAFVRSFVIVFVLLVSIVGVPWGIRQIVRYQFIAQAVMYDERSGKEALDRSSELVRGRWFHTAIIAALLNGAVGLSALIVALIILITATGIPLWAISILTTVVYALTVPIQAIAMTLLYGDAIAEQEAGRSDGTEAAGGTDAVAAPA